MEGETTAHDDRSMVPGSWGTTGASLAIRSTVFCLDRNKCTGTSRAPCRRSTRGEISRVCSQYVKLLFSPVSGSKSITAETPLFAASTAEYKSNSSSSTTVATLFVVMVPVSTYESLSPLPIVHDLLAGTTSVK